MPSTSVPSVLAKFHHHFRGELRAQLKPLAHVLGIGENTIRNNSNVIRIDGQDVRPVKINGRWTYDLAEIAEALTSAHARASDHGAPAEIAAKLDAAHAHIGRDRGRPRKPGISFPTGGAV